MFTNLVSQLPSHHLADKREMNVWLAGWWVLMSLPDSTHIMSI